MIYLYEIANDHISVIETEPEYELIIDMDGRHFCGYCGVSTWIGNTFGEILVREAKDFTEFADWVEGQYPEIFL